MFRSHPLAARFILFVLVPVLIGGLASAKYLNASLPLTEGEVAATGIESPVAIVRDQFGVPYIEAESEADAYYAMGFVHAQDRLWQLELQRRVAKGRLSEIFGKTFVSQDAWFRTLGLYGAASSSRQALSERSRRALDAYSAGINDWINQGHTLPVEFSAYGITPEPWTAEDSLAWIKVFALDLSGNFNSEIERFLTVQYMSPEQGSFLHAGYPEDAPKTLNQDAGIVLGKLLGLRKEAERKLQIGGKFVGSNAWVVSGKHTQSGSPILANDPHLGLQMPSLWYAVSLKAPGLNVSGMSLVGLPLVVFGRNADIAWGGTNMMADTQDLYFEQINPANPRQYRVGDAWRDFAVRSEVIRVKADFPAFLRKSLKPVTVEVRTSRHGPIVSDALGSFDQPVALRWTALDAGDTTFDAFLGLHYAKNWDEFRSSMSLHVAPALNMLYADKHNNIGYLGVGRIPVRKKGEGTIPVPGWTDDYEWISSIPAEQMPQGLNPPAGYYVSANNRIAGNEYPFFISHDWAPPARAMRIEQLIRKTLDSNAKFDMARMQSMQADTLSLPAARLLPLLNEVRPTDDRQKEVLSLLANWKGDMSADSVAASIFQAWTRHLREAIFSDEISQYWNKPRQSDQLGSVVAQVSLDQMADAIERDPASGSSVPDWCDDVRTSKHESCEQILQRSLKAALVELEKLKGSDVEEWTWGSVQRVDYAHLPFSQIRALESIFGRRVEGAGSTDTINVASSYFRESEGYLQNFGAGFRQVIEIGREQTTHALMNSTGQSGHFLSRHYDDMVLPFRDARFHRIEKPQSPGETETLRLRRGK